MQRSRRARRVAAHLRRMARRAIRILFIMLAAACPLPPPPPPRPPPIELTADAPAGSAIRHDE